MIWLGQDMNPGSSKFLEGFFRVFQRDSLSETGTLTQNLSLVSSMHLKNSIDYKRKYTVLKN